MIFYVKYDENEELVDIINVPNFTLIKLEQKQYEFFKWLFNKKNNHKYWRDVNGEKNYCTYDVSAFIEWLNINVFNSFTEKARLVQMDAKPQNADVDILYF